MGGDLFSDKSKGGIVFKYVYNINSLIQFWIIEIIYQFTSLHIISEWANKNRYFWNGNKIQDSNEKCLSHMNDCFLLLFSSNKSSSVVKLHTEEISTGGRCDGHVFWQMSSFWIATILLTNVYITRRTKETRIPKALRNEVTDPKRRQR